MGRVQQRKVRYPQPKTWPGGTPAPFIAAIALVLVLAGGLAVAVDAAITWPEETALIETPVYRHPAPVFSSTLEPSIAAEDSDERSDELDWMLGWDGGRFFTQTNGQPLGTSKQGFAVTNGDDIEFWVAYKDLGGRRVLGFPLSRRFIYHDRVTQAFQRGVFQWDPGSKSVTFVNVLDDLSAQGNDGWLLQELDAPMPLPGDYDRGKVWDQLVRDRVELLAADGVILGAYLSVPDPVTLYGLPTSRVEDRGKYTVVRLQRAIIKHWKIDADDPRAGQLQFMGAGEIGQLSGLFPAEAFIPEDPPERQQE